MKLSERTSVWVELFMAGRLKAGCEPKRPANSVIPSEVEGPRGTVIQPVLRPRCAPLRMTGLNIFHLFIQLPLQMPPDRFLDRSSFSGNSLFFGLPLLAGARFERAWQMRNLWTIGAHLFLAGPCVRFHGYRLI